MAEAIRPEQLTDEQQSFPRILLFEFHDTIGENEQHVARLELLDVWPNAFPDGEIILDNGKIQGFSLPTYVGEPLTDNSLTNDGYRFHDAFHIGVMTGIGWSPVMRSLLHLKRRADPVIDEVDDGGRAIVLEESLFDFLGMGKVEFGSSIEEDLDLGFAVAAVKFAVDERGTGIDKFTSQELRHALLGGARLFHEVRRNLGGYVLANLDNCTVIYLPRDEATYVSPVEMAGEQRVELHQQRTKLFE